MGASWRGEWPPTFTPDTHPPSGECVVYLTFNAAGRILYIGKSDDFRRRMLQHAEKSAWPEVCASWSAIGYGRDRQAMDREEIELIETLAPPFNDQHSPKGAVKLRRQARTRATMWPTSALVDSWQALAVETVKALAVGVVSVLGLRAGVRTYGVVVVFAAGCGAGVWSAVQVLKVCARLTLVRVRAGRVNTARTELDRNEIVDALEAGP